MFSTDNVPYFNFPHKCRGRFCCFCCPKKRKNSVNFDSRECNMLNFISLKITNFAHITRVNCSNCQYLRTIETLPNLEELKCNNCELLTMIYDMPNLLSLSCEYSTKLRNIPKSPKLQSLFATGCYELKYMNDLTEMPNISNSVLSHGVLLTQWKTDCKDVVQFRCCDSPMMHYRPTSFVKFQGYTHIGLYFVSENRPLNGIAVHFVLSFKTCKKLYSSE